MRSKPEATGTTHNPMMRGMRWLLQLDLPVPQRTDAENSAEMRQNYRWNFAVNVLDGATFWFGLSFASAATVVPLFVSKITPSPLAIGLVAVIAQGAWFVPQLFTANAVERMPRKKPVVVNFGFFAERLPMWGLPIAAFLALKQPYLALALFFICFAWHGIGAGIIATAWQDLIARIFPVRHRGRFMGITMFLGAALGAIGAGGSAWILKTFPFPTNFVYTFLIAAIGINLSWVFLAMTRETVQPVKNVPRRSNREYLSELPKVIKGDPNFARYLIARLTMALGGLGVGFLTVSAVTRWQLGDGTVGIYTAAYLIGQTVGNLTLGFLADRKGHKLSMEFGVLASCVAFGIAWLAPSPEWFYLVFALIGVTAGATFVSGTMIVLEFCEPERRPTYAGVANTGTGLVGMLTPMLGAWLAMAGYNWLFAAGLVVNGIALIMLRWWVREPRLDKELQVLHESS